MAAVIVQVRGRPTAAEVVSESAKTVWVRLRNGDVVKRHRVKHGMGVIRAGEPA